MEVRFGDRRLERLESDARYTAGYGRAVVKGFRKVMQWIRAAPDERDFYNIKSLHYEKLRGERSHQRSMRLNDQFRLILEIEELKGKSVVIVSIEDYH